MSDLCLEDAALTCRLQTVQRVLTAATSEASTAMGRWTGGLVRLTLDEVREIDLADACSELAVGEEMLTMVALHVAGELGGDILLVFDEVQGRRLAKALLENEAAEDGPWSELEKSVLAETGNILGCTYMNAFARLLGEELMPSPPCFVQDYGASVLQQVLMGAAMECDRLLICRTHFENADEKLDWQVLFVPTVALRHRLESVNPAVA